MVLSLTYPFNVYVSYMAGGTMNIKYLWVIMLSISVVLFLFQVSIDNINPGGATTLYNHSDSLIGAYDSGGYNLEVNVEDGIPELPDDVTGEDSSGFTDIFQSVKNWFSDTKAGKIISGLYYGVPNLVKGIGMPEAFSYAIGFLWLLLSIFSFVLFMRGLI